MLSSPGARGSKGERFGLGRQASRLRSRARSGIRARHPLNSAASERRYQVRTEQPLSVYAPNPHFETPQDPAVTRNRGRQAFPRARPQHRRDVRQLRERQRGLVPEPLASAGGSEYQEAC
jgi:hypothetical protein